MAIGRLETEADLDRHVKKMLHNGVGLTTPQAVRGLTDQINSGKSPLVTALPSDPSKGQRCVFIADEANGVFWELVYDGEGPYPWKSIGGRPLAAVVAASQTRSAAGYGDLATIGPSITLPLEGDYDVTVGCHAFGAGATPGYQFMSYAIGAAAAVDADAYEEFGNGGAQGTFTRRKTGLAASTALVAKYKTLSSTSGTWYKRALRAMPVRVG